MTIYFRLSPVHTKKTALGSTRQELLLYQFDLFCSGADEACNLSIGKLSFSLTTVQSLHYKYELTRKMNATHLTLTFGIYKTAECQKSKSGNQKTVECQNSKK